MSAKTVEEVLAMHGLSKTKPRPSFREHVLTCTHCTVDPDGEVWACDYGAQLRQAERKAAMP